MTLFDTSILIDMLKGEREFMSGNISIITLIEVLRGVDDEKRGSVKKLLEKSFDVVELNNDVIMRYCELYNMLKRDGNPIPDADLLIAAAADSIGEELITYDKDFSILKRYKVKINVIG